MKVVLDTNSLLSLVRYYLPFDKNGLLFNLIQDKIFSGEIIIVDKVLEECEYISKGIVISTLSFLQDKKFLKESRTPYKTDSLIAPSPEKFLRQLDNNFVNVSVKRIAKLTEPEYESRKDNFLNGADMRQIILCLNLVRDFKEEEIILVTEETESGNDNKLFKKIPTICHELNLKTINLPGLLQIYKEIDFEFS